MVLYLALLNIASFLRKKFKINLVFSGESRPENKCPINYFICMQKNIKRDSFYE